MDPLQLLSGDAQTFTEKVWASRIHVHHTHPAELERLLSLDDVDTLLTSTALRTPALRLAKDGHVLASSEFTRSASLAGTPLTGLVDGRKVLDLFEDGTTVVLQGLHRYWPPLTHLIRELELTLGHPCQANAYLTPPGSQGFDLHRDTHDVFVFQTHGRKEWEVHDDSGAHTVVMEPGVSMYLPTGTPHAARTQRTASLHVTIGINQVTWHQLLGRATERILADAVPDDPLPAGYPHAPAAFAAELAERLRSLAAALGRADTEAIADAEVSRFHTTRNPMLGGALRDRLALSSITDDTMLRRRPGSACLLVPADDQVRVLLGDRELRVPARLAEPLTHVRDHPTFRPSDLAGWLDDESRLVLSRRLVREGLLQVEA